MEKGAALSQVRDLLGHASITTTERYDNQTFAVLRTAAERLESGKSFTIPSQLAENPAQNEAGLVAKKSGNPLEQKGLTKLAGRQGFEPRYRGPEPRVLPLDDLPPRSGSTREQEFWIIDGRVSERQAREGGTNDPTVVRGGADCKSYGYYWLLKLSASAGSAGSKGSMVSAPSGFR